MATSASGETIDALIQRKEWEGARARIREELASDPDNHWLLTQLGVTYYEQRQYRESLKWFLKSFAIVPDCPLTLWNLAGALDAIGKPKMAVTLYRWLLQSDVSPEDDPCWESEEWTESLKTDCVYRLGLCFEHLGRKESAEHCFRQYIQLLLIGVNGMYPIEDAVRHIRGLRGTGKNQREKEVQATFDATFEDEGLRSIEENGRELPRLNFDELLSD